MRCVMADGMQRARGSACGNVCRLCDHDPLLSCDLGRVACSPHRAMRREHALATRYAGSPSSSRARRLPVSAPMPIALGAAVSRRSAFQVTRCIRDRMGTPCRQERAQDAGQPVQVVGGRPASCMQGHPGSGYTVRRYLVVA